jgi:hypothetical protein
MHPSLLTQSRVNDLLAQACQNKENDQQVEPMLFLASGTNDLRILPLLDLAADALAKRAQMYAIGRQFPDTTEAVFICESWIAPPSRVAPSEHPGRQEAIILVGRNRDNTKGVFAKQVFTTKNNRINWQEPDITTKPGSAEGLVDLIFAP